MALSYTGCFHLIVSVVSTILSSLARRVIGNTYPQRAVLCLVVGHFRLSVVVPIGYDRNFKKIPLEYLMASTCSARDINEHGSQLWLLLASSLLF